MTPLHKIILERFIDKMKSNATNPSFDAAGDIVLESLNGTAFDEDEFNRHAEMASMSFHEGTKQQVKNIRELVKLLKSPAELIAKINEECPNEDGVNNPILYIVLDAFLVQRTLGAVDATITYPR